MIKKIGFGGGCHWCTEAVFASLIGVERVEQGWIASDGENSTFSEAVIVTFDSEKIALEQLAAVHLHTHSCTSEHPMRSKYRSAIYTFSEPDGDESTKAIQTLQADFDQPVVTQVLRYCEFKRNREDSLNYYYSDPTRPFCERYIHPKLALLLRQFSAITDNGKLGHLPENQG